MMATNMTGKVTKDITATATPRAQKVAVMRKYCCVWDIKWAEMASTIREKSVVTPGACVSKILHSGPYCSPRTPWRMSRITPIVESTSWVEGEKKSGRKQRLPFSSLVFILPRQERTKLMEY